MSLWRSLLGLGREEASAGGDSDAIRRIAKELQQLEPERARYLAAFAYVLGRVAHADRDISDDETRVMELIVMEVGHLPEPQAVLVVEIAKAQNILAGGTESFIATRELAQMASAEQRQEILHCLFAVAAADDSISGTEESQVRQIASELRMSQHEYVAVRRSYNDLREVVRELRRVSDPS